MNPWLTILLWATYLLSLYFSVFWMLILIENLSSFTSPRPRKPTQEPLVSVIIPARNEEDTIQATIQSVLSLQYPKDKLEVIVVCNATTDSTVDIIKGVIRSNPDSRIRLVYQPEPGKGRALNRGLRLCRGTYFACLDADSTVESDTLRKMLATYEDSPPETVIVTPAMKIRNPSNLCQRLQRIEYLLSMLVSRLMALIDCQYVAPGPFSLYRTDAIKSLGGFDEENLTEDMEIAYRVQRHHLKITHCPDAWVHTVGPSTAKALYAQRNRWFKGGLLNWLKNKDLFANKAYGDFGILQMSVNITLFFFSMTAILFFSYYMIWPVLRNLYDLYLIGFDIWPLLTHLKLTFSPLYIDVEKVFIANFIMLLTLAFMWLSHKNAQEPIKHARWTIVPYVFVYYLVLSFIALVVVAETAVGRYQKW